MCPAAQAGDQASLAGNVPPCTIDLEASDQHLGTLAMDAGTQNGCWTIVSTGGGKLLLDNGTNPAAIRVGSGTGHTIGTTIDLLSPTTIELSSPASALTISGVIDTPTACTLTINGPDAASPDSVAPNIAALHAAGVILTAANTYGNTNISAGKLQVGNGGTTGSLGTGAVLDNGTLAFNRADALSVANAITGTGGVQQAGAGVTTITSAANYSGPTAITGGQLTFGGGVAHSIAGVTGTGVLAVAAGTTLTSDGVNMPAGALVINGLQTIRSSSGAAYAAADPTAPLTGTSKVAALTFTSNTVGQLDLKNNALIIEATPATLAGTLATVSNEVNPANVGGSFPNITSSSVAAAPANYALVVAANSDINAYRTANSLPPSTSFGGLAVDNNSVIVTEALQGDANLDGFVDLSDLTIWYNNVGIGANSVAAGDLNNDGHVDLSDLTLWYNHVGNNTGGNPTPATTSMDPGLSAGSSSGAVPEPASLAVLALGAVGLLTRKRKNPALALRQR